MIPITDVSDNVIIGPWTTEVHNNLALVRRDLVEQNNTILDAMRDALLDIANNTATNVEHLKGIARGGLA